MADATEPTTLTAVIDDLTRRGFTEHFTLTDEGLRGVNSARTFPADEITISEYHRFEGVSDPDDMSILYAIETSSGIRGTLTDAFGVYSDPLLSAFLAKVHLRMEAAA